jgi:hypothetical protein
MAGESIIAAEGFLPRLRELAERRRTLEGEKRQLAEARAAWEAGHADLIMATLDAARGVEALTAELKAAALGLYAARREQRPAPGVEVRLYRKVEFGAEARLLAWARQTGLGLTVDRKAVEKIALATPLEADIARVLEDPRVFIAADLDAALASYAEGPRITPPNAPLDIPGAPF